MNTIAKAPQSTAIDQSALNILSAHPMLTRLQDQFNSLDKQLANSYNALGVLSPETIANMTEDDLCLLESGKNDYPVYVSNDAEWFSEYRKGFANWLQSGLVIVYYCPKLHRYTFQVFLFTSNDLSENAISSINTVLSSVDRITLVYQSLPEQAPLVEEWMVSKGLSPKYVELLGKFSPLDYHAYFGENVWLEMIDNRLVTQKRCLRFDVKEGFKGRRSYKPHTLNFLYRLRDLQGLNTGSLKTQAESVNCPLFAKDDLPKRYLEDMRLGYSEDPLRCTLYNICDSFANMQIALSYPPLVNLIIEKLGLPESCKINLNELPHTTGSLVGMVFCKFISHYPLILQKRGELDLSETELQNLLESWQMALWKNAKISDSISGKDSVLARRILMAQRECKTLDDYKSTMVETGRDGGKGIVTESLFKLQSDSFRMSQMFSGGLYQQACARVFGSNTDSTVVFAALVQGGRCNNSNPFEYLVKRVLDVDMASCYGSTLRKLTYPIGLPTIYSRQNAHGEKLESYDEVYSRLEGELVDDLWFADVSTESHLTFDQDLIFSSYGLSPETIRKAVTGTSHETDEEIGEETEITGDVKKIPNDFVLTRNQIEHGRICASSHRVIKSVGSKEEKGEFNKKLVCNALVYYPKSQQFTDIQLFVNHVLANEGSVTTDQDNNVTDSRTRAWFGVKLEYFTGVLVDERKAVKKEMSKAKNDGRLDDAKALYGKQDMFKLFVNTLYGDLASVYFSFGNTVLANVITDKARVGAWMMSKALRTLMEITDGGFYEVKRVAFNLGDKLAGFDALADWRKWHLIHKARGYRRILAPLGGWSEEDWEMFFKIYDSAVKADDKAQINEMNAKMDELAREHIQQFWQPYGLIFEFGVEHKYEHTAWSAGYMGKSDYCLKVVGGKEDVIKKRGSRPARDNNDLCVATQYRDPAFEFMRGLAEGNTQNYQHRGFNAARLVKVGEFQKAKIDKGEPVENPKTLAEHKKAGTVVPGSELVTFREPRQINNGHTYLRTYADYLTIQKRRGIAGGERLQWFERFVNEPDSMVKAMNDNCLKTKETNRRKKAKK